MSVMFEGREIKYIASDLDGTLLFGEGHKLDDETYDLISKCVDKGIHFIVASGRTYQNEQIVMEPIKDKISYISDSGTGAYHEGKPVLYQLIEKEDAHKIFKITDSIKDCHCFVSTQNGAYTNSNYPPFFDHLVNNVHIHLNLVDDLYSLEYPIEKISAFYEDGSYKVVDAYKKELPNFSVVTSGPQWIDFLQNGINKGNALKVLLNELNIDSKNGLAFGDQENDIEMIETAGIGYCMKTGVPRAKEAADYLIDSPKEILKKLLEQK